MTNPDFRALCAELLDELELWSSWHDATDLKDRAAAALHFDQPEPQPPAAIVEIVNKLHQINNPVIQSVAPTDEELCRRFRAWWHDEGSGLPPLPGMDHKEHVRRISEIAWANGAYAARWGTPANALPTPEAP